MNRLIKAAAAVGQVREFGAASARFEKAPAAVTPAAADEQRLALLEQENGELRAAVAAGAAAAEEAARLSREQGRRDAIEQRQQDDEQRLKALQHGLAQASAEWREQLLLLERLAPLLARSALAKLFHGCDDYSELVARSIALQLEALGREAIVSIHVSARDFPEAESLSSLRAGSRAGGSDIVTDAELAAGECRLKLRMGHLDIGIPSQWRELSALLDEAAFEGVTA